MLTALKVNDDAMRFYQHKLGYVMDVSSPAVDQSDASTADGLCPYLILSKPIGG